jgi:metallophosphoesterase (TIGR00282 family)
MKLLFIGDIVGKPGRKIIDNLLGLVIDKFQIDVVVANAENAAGGMGITPSIAEELFSRGIDIITSGNHIWRKKDIIPFLEARDDILRPANYPGGAPGKGMTTMNTRGGPSLCVINLEGRTFMRSLECPFNTAEFLLDQVREKTNLIVVDFHAESTSEKVALGWFLDGRVSAVVGTHTHVQTADEKILPGGTAYITDAGMTGPMDSVIGIEKEIIIKKFLTQRPISFKVAKKNLYMQGVVVDIDESTGKCVSIQRVNEPFVQ